MNVKAQNPKWSVLNNEMFDDLFFPFEIWALDLIWN
jgi:hypothetical protein